MKPAKKNRNKTLISDKIADALTVKGRADIEDDNVFGTKPKTVTRVDFSSDSENEAVISEFRKRNVNLLSDLSKKYEGEVVSRKDLEENSFEESDTSSDENEVPPKIFKGPYNNGETSGSEVEEPNNIKQSDDDSEAVESEDYSVTKFTKESSSDHESDEGGFDISEMQEPVKESFEHMKKQNVSEEVKKGVSVRNQLLLWENLLETRIHLQRCMNTANKMPMPDCYEELRGNDNNEFVTENNITKVNLTNILDKLLHLQDVLYKNFPDTKSLSSNKPSNEKLDKTPKAEESDEEIPSDTDNEEIPSDTETEEMETQPNVKEAKLNLRKKRKLDDYEKELSNRHKAFKTFRDSTIQKWNEKTRLASAANLKNAPTNTILQQISYILSDRDKLIHRTQFKRSEYDIVGYVKPEINNDTTKSRKDDDEYISEIFDDTDFYHQLLRELIECKSADISDPVQLSRQWIALQQMRSKMKRKVDTKATKGRRIKYVVHNKLVNFMAPEKNATWTDESKSELYNSLFGKLFESNNGLTEDNSFLVKDV